MTASSMTWEVSGAAVSFRRPNGDLVSVSVILPACSRIVERGHAPTERLPDDWREVGGLHRVAGSIVGPDGVKAFLSTAMPWLFMMSGGRPLVFQCSRKHYELYKNPRVFGDRLTVLAGSMAGDAPIVDDSFEDGDDEQIVLLQPPPAAETETTMKNLTLRLTCTRLADDTVTLDLTLAQGDMSPEACKRIEDAAKVAYGSNARGRDFHVALKANGRVLRADDMSTAEMMNRQRNLLDALRAELEFNTAKVV